MFSRSQKIGNVLSAIGSQGFRKQDFGPDFLKLIQNLRELNSGPEGHFVQEVPASAGKNGQPEGSAVKSKTGKPRAANQDLVSGNAAGQNNSNLTSRVTSVSDDEWELLSGIVPIIVL